MKRKVDFTVKGTRLPFIPKETKYNVENSKGGYVSMGFELKNMVSFGIASDSEIFAELPCYTGKLRYIFNLSTIESLAEQQGMLWVEESDKL